MNFGNIKKIHLIESGPQGDIFEIELVTGFVMEVDPKTYKTTDRPQRFKAPRGSIERAPKDTSMVIDLHPAPRGGK